MTGVAARGLTVRRGGRAVVDGVDLTVTAGEVVAVVGPNGAGKSTLLAALAGDTRADAGAVTLGGRAVPAYRPRELARQRAVLPQRVDVPFPFPAREVVLMGRHPHLRPGRPPGADDDARVEVAMADLDVAHLADRPFPRLSGGEQARVALARVLVQDAPVVLLDEPSSAFDLHHQSRLVRIVRRLAREGRAVVVVLHDLNLASACADRVALLRAGRLLACEAPDDALVPALLDPLYGQRVVVVRHPTTGRPVVIPDHDDATGHPCPDPAPAARPRQEAIT